MESGRNITPESSPNETKRIEMELHQKTNRLIWKGMKQQSEKTPYGKSRLEVFGVIEKSDTHQNETIQMN